ncbi:MAG TPA: ABC transporter permease [Gaiellaceae bacterium]|nr:ABC transporter permease [Gaiellaceae bacterium]
MSGPPPPVVIPNFGSASHCVTSNGLFCTDWFTQNWSGVLQPALVQHVELTAKAVGIGFAIAFLAAIAASRFRFVEAPFGAFSAFVYTIPSLALFQLLIPVTGLTDTTVEVALVGYTLLILFRNILAGLRGVADDVIEAARGMGLTETQILWRIQLPLALPSIVAGIRIAVVSTISLATIAAFVRPVGLGEPIFIAIQDNIFKTELIAAGGLAVALALASDLTLVLVQRALTPWARARAA